MLMACTCMPCKGFDKHLLQPKKGGWRLAARAPASWQTPAAEMPWAAGWPVAF